MNASQTEAAHGFSLPEMQAGRSDSTHHIVAAGQWKSLTTVMLVADAAQFSIG